MRKGHPDDNDWLIVFAIWGWMAIMFVGMVGNIVEAMQ